MKIQPVTGPGAIRDLSTPEHVRTARAVEAFNRGASSKDAPPPAPTQGQLQEHPVADANNISAEELSAIAPQTQTLEIPEENGDTQTANEVPEEKPKEDPALSRQFAQLARQERALRAKQQQQEQAYKARLAELEAREKALEGKSQFNPDEYVPKARLKQDALSVLEAEGITYDQLTERAMSRVPVDPVLQQTIDALNAKIAALEAKTGNVEKTYQEQQQTQYQSAIKQITNDAIALIKNNPEEYEAIAKTKTVKQVVKLIEDTYNKDGILLSVEEAAQEVENYLVEENYRMASSIDKIKKRMATAAQQRPTDEKTQAPKQQSQPGMKTLTNAASSSRQLSAKERAILAFKGELKS
jgi:hypothetical protein